jgi:UDP-N-acetylmuramate: L-alanyl-gamma-D-glutamyl-meso-diaminopimelate ligase
LEKARNIHFIGLEDPLLCDLAIALLEVGNQVTGSYEQLNTTRSAKLLKYNLLPSAAGWFPEKITKEKNEIVISSLVRPDNPELKRAQELKLDIYSIPDIIYRHSLGKQRLVVIGNYGKTTIVSLMAHVLSYHHRKFDVVSGVETAGNDLVKLSDAPVIIIEGQDVMSSCLDSTPQFLKYHHHVGVISGIEWQQSPEYPTREAYTRQYGLFVAATPKSGVLIYVEFDPVIAVISKISLTDVFAVPYKAHPSTFSEGKEFLLTHGNQQVAMKISGKHNLQYISAAQEALKKIGITAEMFYQAIPSFEGVRI